MERQTEQYKTIEQIVSRLNRRKELLVDAERFFCASQGMGSLEVSEREEIRGLCFPKGIAPPPVFMFACSKSESYDESNYDTPCSSIYKDCGEKAKTVTCPETPPFNCPGHIYSCTSYDCPKDFICKSEADFECSGSTFECKTDFQCNGGHVFVCNHVNNCPDIFGCEGGKDCISPHECDNTSTKGYGFYGCPDQNKYGTLHGPYGSFLENPGDFMCGFGMGTKSEHFTCPKDFECKGKDGFSDFMCADGTIFICGRQGQGDFDCEFSGSALTPGFSCYLEIYECNGAKVSCSTTEKPSNEYGCSFKDTTYNQCPTKSCTSKALYGLDPPPPPPPLPS